MAIATSGQTGQIEAAAFGDYLERLADRVAAGPYDKPLEECRDLAKQNIRDNFTSSATPGGESWPPRKILGDGHPLLMDTGKLLQAATGGGSGNVEQIESHGENHELTYGVSLDAVPYARAHDLGYPPRNLPERHYLGVSEETIDAFESVIAEHIENEII